jgi:hypothetical protein
MPRRWLVNLMGAPTDPWGVPGTRSPYREQPSKRDTSLRNAPLRMGD